METLTSRSGRSTFCAQSFFVNGNSPFKLGRKIKGDSKNFASKVLKQNPMKCSMQNCCCVKIYHLNTGKVKN